MKMLGKILVWTGGTLLLGVTSRAQMVDNTQATSTTSAGINKSLSDEIGPGRGSIMTPGSPLYITPPSPISLTSTWLPRSLESFIGYTLAAR